MESVLDIGQKVTWSPANIPHKPVAVPLNCKASMVQGEDIDTDVVSETCSV